MCSRRRNIAAPPALLTRTATGIVSLRIWRWSPATFMHLYQATFLFGAAGIGLQLPATALAQSRAGQAWDVVAGAAIDGGHYVPLVGRQAAGLHVVSWGMVQVMTETFLKQYCDEAIAYVSQECLIDQKSPEGFSYDDLMSDLAALA